MKKKPSPETKLVLLLILVASLGALVGPAPSIYAQNATNSPTVNPSESQQQQLAEAQRKYYEAQAAKLDQERSLSQRVINLSAFLAALVAVLSLVLNYSSTLRMQRDTQFYEALKRFGDKDSATVRSSAAGLLAKLSNQRGILFRWQRPNFDIALDQLLVGSLLEDNPVCLTSIKNALRQLTVYSPLKVIEKMREANSGVQEDMVEALALFQATKTLDAETVLADKEHWVDAAAWTPYNEEVLHTLVNQSRGFFADVHPYEDVFRRGCQAASQEYGSMDQAKRPEHVIAAQKALRLAGSRLSLNVEIFSIVLKTNPFRNIKFRMIRPKIPGMKLEYVFLVNSDLSSAKLQAIDLFGAQLQGTNLRWADLRATRLVGTNLHGASIADADLRRANLCFADLQGADFEFSRLERAWVKSANLQYAGLREAKLYSTELDDSDLGNSNWWMANFESDGRIDENLLAKLFKRYGDKVPKDIRELHWSVRNFIEKHPQESQQS